MIHVENLTKHYGSIKAVDNISFDVGKGEIVGVLGPNGAGKSTTLRILTSYLAATSGIATVAGFDVMNQSEEVRRSMGYLPQAVPIYPEMPEEAIMHVANVISHFWSSEYPKVIKLTAANLTGFEHRTPVLSDE